MKYSNCYRYLWRKVSSIHIYIYMNVLKHAIFQLNGQPFYLSYILLCYLDSLSRNIAFKVMSKKQIK